MSSRGRKTGWPSAFVGILEGLEERASRREGVMEDPDVEMAEAGRFWAVTWRFVRSLRVVVEEAFL